MSNIDFFISWMLGPCNSLDPTSSFSQLMAPGHSKPLELYPHLQLLVQTCLTPTPTPLSPPPNPSLVLLCLVTQSLLRSWLLDILNYSCFPYRVLLTFNWSPSQFPDPNVSQDGHGLHATSPVYLLCTYLSTYLLSCSYPHDLGSSFSLPLFPPQNICTGFMRQGLACMGS